jgi:peptide/nickel transport system ATP-binding protein
MVSIEASEAGADVPTLALRDIYVVYKARTGSLFRRDRIRAVRGVDFDIYQGETTGVVGESGCGKTTLARVLVGLQRPTSGDVLFNGLPMAGGAKLRRAIGRTVSVVFQDPMTALNPRMVVRDTLLDPLQVHRIGDRRSREQRVKELLDLVRLPESVLDVLPAQISGGQRQRVAIARALSLGPRVMVVDEPTSALDVSVRAQILNLLEELKSELDVGMVFISHDINTVRQVSDRIAVMNAGEILEFAPTETLFSMPENEYTRTLLSAAPTLL